MNIEPASRLAPLSPAPAPGHPVTWVVGSVHPAQVLKRHRDGRVTLRVDNEEFLADTPPDQALPQAFRVRVTRSGNRPELELVGDEGDDDDAARSRALLALIPRQAGLSSLLAELNAVHEASDTRVAPAIQAAMAQVNAAIAAPSAFAGSTMVSQVLENSGLLLEARLLDTARSSGYRTFASDWKASLLGLIAALAPYPATAQVDSRSDLPPPQPLRGLPRQPRGQRVPWRANGSDWGRLHHAALGVVARLEIAQLQAGARQPAWLFEIPMRGRGGLDILQLRFSPQPASTGGDWAWMIEIAIDLPALGAIGAEVRIVGNRVRVQFWAELSAVARRIESSLAALAGKLQLHGLIVEHVACRYGRPESSPGASGGLLSATA